MQANRDQRGPSHAAPDSPAPAALPTSPDAGHAADVTDAAFELAAVGLTLTDERGRFVRVNKAFADACGYAPLELIGRDYTFLLPPEERAEAEHRLRERAAASDPAKVPAPTRDWQIVAKDGRRRVLRTTGNTFFRPGTDPAAGRWLMVTATLDVTAERQTERALLEAGQRLNTILSSITDGYMVFDAQYRFVEINPAAQRMVFGGRPAQELIGKVFWDEYPQARDTEVFRQYQRAFRENAPVHFEALSAIAGRWFETHAYPRDGKLEVYVRDITERKEAEAVLREALDSMRDSESHVRLIADNVPALISYADRGLCYRFANNAYQEWFGMAPGEVIGKMIPQVVGPELYEQRRPYIERALRGERVAFEGQTRHKVLGLRDTEVRYAPDPDPDDPTGPVRGFFVFVYDITDRKRAEQALADSEREFRAMFELANSGKTQADPHTGRFLRVNRRFCEITGYSEGELLGLTFVDITHPDERDWERENHERILRGDVGEWQREKRYVRKDGRVVWVTVAGSAIRDAGGRPVRLVATVQDVTARKQAEAEAARANERAERSLAQLQAIFHSMTDAMIVADPAGNLIDWNPAALRLHGFATVDECCRRLDDLSQAYSAYDLNGRQVPARDWPIARALRGETFSQEEVVLRRNDTGLSFVGSFCGTPVRDRDGNIILAFVTIRDVTAQKQGELALEHARQDAELARTAAEEARAVAEAANSAKDRFLAVLSHELRTPLTPVVMTLAGLEMDRGLSQGVRDDLSMIRRNVELETKLIDDLLDVTRIVNGKLRLNVQPADAHALVAGVTDLFQSESRTKRVALLCELAAADARVGADAARLQQVFWNLVRNAIKFTPEGGSVTVRTFNPAPRRLAVEVSDTGIGIEPAALPRLFNAFEQAEQSITRRFGGLGLGLAISKALVDLHGGTIRADSAGRGRGATFTVELPILAAPERLPTHASPPRAGAANRAESGTTPPAFHPPTRPVARVLLVEDHPDTLRILKRLLEKMGYEVVTASSVAAGLDALTVAPVDVIVSDIGLPDGTGHDLIRQVKASPALAALPAIAISGFGMDSDVRTSRDAGFVTHMTKPVDVRQLDAAIRTAVKRPAGGQPST